ncbi:sperm microtubule associated protein 2-like [Antedon mediterranea]|uniref:sperm microtubule associated protein 2-like n=1 Tax=Antedon mediterranea TaxID=105859 RepID=UPI003AF516D3
MATVARERRTDVLSRPKQLPVTYQEDRRSVYWRDSLPLKPGPDGSTVFVLTPRQEQLCGHKVANPGYQFDRSYPIWPVKESAKQYEATGRIEKLSFPKSVHRDYVPERAVMTRVTSAAQKAEPSARIEQLAREKNYLPLKIKESWEFDCYQWDPEISKGAKKAQASAWVERLAESRQTHPSYQYARSVEWHVEDPALKAIATLRLQQLARPKSRGKLDNFDPYRVSSSARNARATPRISELCMPIPRKVRQKKF